MTNQLNDKTSSFSLLRTNPRISGNVKLTTDSSGDIWLNTFSANSTLSNSQYKKFQPANSFESDLQAFIGNLNPNIVFDVFEEYPNPTVTSMKFTDQYDFFYAMGAQPNTISQYSEDYSYLAPIWLQEDVPQYFVIFAVDTPMDFPYNVDFPSGSLVDGDTYLVYDPGNTGFSIRYNATIYQAGQTFTATPTATYAVASGSGNIVNFDENSQLPINRVTEFQNIVKNARVVATFDMTPASKLGQYVRAMRNKISLAPVSVTFTQGQMTNWNGVSYQDGVIASKGQTLDSYWAAAQTQIDFEDFITDGFHRQGIICQNLVNLEFMFNDAQATTYSIPRYFGFYVNTFNTALVQLDGNALYKNRAVSGDTPLPKVNNRGYNYQGQPFVQNNPHGVRLYYTDVQEAAPDQPAFVPSSDTFDAENFQCRLYYVQDKNGGFHSLDETGNNSYNTDPIVTSDLVVRDTTLDLGTLAGAGAVALQDKGGYLTDAGRSYMVYTVNSVMSPNDQVFLYWTIGNLTDAFGKHHVLTANDLSKRPFTLAAGGTLLTFASPADLTDYTVGQVIQIVLANGTSYERTITIIAGATLTIDSSFDAITTAATTPIVPGWGPGSAMLSQDNTTIYFHPYGTVLQVATAVAKAFNLIEDKKFDAVVMPSLVSGSYDCVLRFRESGFNNNLFFSRVSLTSYSSVSLQGLAVSGPAQLVNLDGGTDRSNVRCLFPLDKLDVLSAPGIWAQTTKSDLSQLLFAGRYVDAAINTPGTSEVGTLNGYTQYGVFVIANNADTVFLSSGTRDFITYFLYQIPVGMFSFYKNMDFDMDFFSSTYGRNPTPEYHRYFDIQAGTSMVLVPGRKYLVLHDPSALTVDSISYLGSTITAPGSAPFYAEFVAGEVVNEAFGTGNGANHVFSHTTLYPPVGPNTVTVTGGIETFTDDGHGHLSSNHGGTGTIDYVTGLTDLTFGTLLGVGVPITMNYYSLDGFTVSTGNPFVVAEIFYSKVVMPYTDQLDPSHTYAAFGNPSDGVTLDSFSPSPLFASPAGTQFVPSNQSPFSIYAGNPYVIDLSAFALDPDLAAFPGFWTFKDFIPVADVIVNTNTLQFQNRDKFTYADLNSEYDYLKENFTTTEAVNSRLVPTVSKWVFQGGSDIRDNDYRLNTNPAFGQLSFTPSFDVSVQDPNNFTHEWYYLEQPPQNYPVGSLGSDNYYFFYDKLDFAQLTDADPTLLTDYFEEYFTFEPAPETPEQERYSILSYNPKTGFSETLFRGVFLRIKEVVANTVSSQLQNTILNKPPFLQNSTKYDGYRFSVLLRVHKQDNSIVESPVTLQVVENATAKTLTFLVDVILEDYRTLDLVNPFYLGQAASPDVTYPATLDLTVDYLLLYSMKSKKTEALFVNESIGNFPVQGIDASRIGDIKLSCALDFSLPSAIVGQFSVVNVFPNPGYDFDMRDEVKNFGLNNVFVGEFIYGTTQLPFALSSNQSQVLFGIAGNNTYPQYLTYPNTGGWPNFAAGAFGIPPFPAGTYPDFYAPANPIVVFDPTLPTLHYDQNITTDATGTVMLIPSGTPFDWMSLPTIQLQGGSLYLEPILQRISFAKIAEKINNYNPVVRYRTFTWDAATRTSVETDNTFYLEMIPPNPVTKTQALIPQVDDNKPEELKTYPIIGVTYTTVNSFQDMVRYNGPYEPKFRPVTYFAEQKSDALAQSPDTSLAFLQATFDPNMPDFGNIDNFNYLKVANGDILALANNTAYPSLYPLIGEVAIDQRNFWVFQSNWDPGYWRKYIDKVNVLPQAGTRELTEGRNFLGSKIMRTNDKIQLQTFTVEELPSVENIDTTNLPAGITWSQVGNVIEAYIDVYDTLLAFLLSDGADAVFKKYLLPQFGPAAANPTDIESMVRLYLQENVLPLYQVSAVQMYVKSTGQNLNLPIVIGTLTDTQKVRQGYTIVTNFTTKNLGNLVYYFTYTIPAGTNVSIAPSITISKI